MELVGTEHRAQASVIIGLGYSLAVCATPLIAYFIQEWQTLMVVCSAPYFVLMLFWKFIPESIRWLRLKNRMEDALQVFERIAKWNGKETSTNEELAPLKDTTHKSNPKELFNTNKRRRKTILLGFAWMINGMVYYGISLAVGDFGGSLYRDFALVSVVEIPAMLCVIDFPNRFGRQKTTMVCTFLTGVLTLAVAFIPTSYQVVRTTFGMIGKFLIAISFQVIYVWSVELYPTKIKSEAMGFLQITSRIGAASAPWIAKGVKVIHESLPFIIMGSLGLLAGILCWFLPDTKGQEMQETENDYESQQETVNLKDLGNSV
ncbi:solute carrier family 22 member 13-like [Clytia hemisphaerica]|uniref:solute carrier family 22 member 13-like n=1 Tax=Clytia hemisphaerica TaxID=252671 RepID=UPI0034D48338